MPRRELIRHCVDAHGRTELLFGNVDSSVPELDEFFNLYDQLQEHFGGAVLEREINIATDGGVTVTVKLEGLNWLKHENEGARAVRMLRWLILKLSTEELKYLGVLPRLSTRAASSYSVDQLIAGLSEEFDRFVEADDRLAKSVGQRR